jgi:hypothetical protein
MTRPLSAAPVLQGRSVLASVWPPTAKAAAAAGHRPMSPMEAIRRKCLDCCVGQIVEVRLCEAVSCPLWPFRAGRHPYTRTRLQEADPAACCDGGTDGAGSPSPSRTALQEASFAESGPSPVVRQD